MCGESDSHTNMTAHIFPQGWKVNHRPSKTVNFPRERIYQLRHTWARRRKLVPIEPHINSQTTNPNRWPSDRPSENKGDFRQENRTVPCDLIHPAKPPPRPRDEKFIFVMNCISPTALLPLHDGVRQCDCRGRHKKFSSRVFCWAKNIRIRCTTRRFPLISRFRTEQFPKHISVPEAAWSPVRKWGGIFVKKSKTPATKYRGLNTVTALLWTKNAPLSMHQFSFFRVVRGVISAVVPQKITGILRRKPLVWFVVNVYHKLYHFGKITSFCRSDISCIIFYPFNVHLKLGGFVPLLSNGNLQA